MTLLTEAIAFAAGAHDGVTRKGSRVPYIVHPMETVAIAASITDDEEVLAAAALHDVMEDCGVSGEVLRARFGGRNVLGLAADNRKHDRVAAVFGGFFKKRSEPPFFQIDQRIVRIR